ncbi:MAG: NFACT family protein [Aphanocapsa lilacina HA4352-LM1]|jgi:predicted ribosome quality control (RQC) complex YloA/Tae2 family protein|nr:NFACT family protein [Aphanocapsa lilacina HA4352-LM1]
MQAVDFTALSAARAEIQSAWIPARVEQIRQDDYQTIKLQLKTFAAQRWLVASCHPQAARLHMGEASRGKGARFSFASTLHQYLGGRVLVRCVQPQWERIVRLGFARRPEQEPEVELHVEVMGKYSNIVLTDPSGQILALAHSVSATQSRVRPLLLGEIYRSPPPLSGPIPNPDEPFASWCARLSVVPGPFAPALFKAYRGVSQTLAQQMLAEAHLPTKVDIVELAEIDWQRLWELWRQWLACLGEGSYRPGWTTGGYTVLGWNLRAPERSVHALLDRYYTAQLQADLLRARRARLQQILKAALAKAVKRRAALEQMLAGAAEGERHKQMANLLMAYLHQGAEPGIKRVVLEDFESGEPVNIPLDPTKDLVANAQAYYRLHRKAKRAQQAVAPLLEQAREEVAYLEQVGATVELLGESTDLEALLEVEEELVQQKYVEAKDKPAATGETVPFHRFPLEGEGLVLVGRNNRQNDRLTFEVASPADLWFHAQEIPGSHVVLKLPPGQQADPEQIQLAANVAAYFSQARQSAFVPVIYTERRFVRKLKGGRPGLVTFRDEKVIWGNPNALPDRGI